MSHFVVGVVIPKEECGSAQPVSDLVVPYLAPFNECVEDCDTKYLVREDQTKENVDSYFSTRPKALVNGELKSLWSEEFQRKATPEEVERIKAHDRAIQYRESHGEYTIMNAYPEDAIKVMVPYCADKPFLNFITDQYSCSRMSDHYVPFGELSPCDMSDYVQEIAKPTGMPQPVFNKSYELQNEDEIREYLMRTYRVYHITNPNAQWDWYVVGGRWDKTLPVKGSLPGVSWAQIKNIDLDPDPDKYNRMIRKWEVVVEKSSLTKEEEEIQNKYPSAFRSPFMDAESLIRYYGSKENYALLQSSFTPYAFITKEKEWAAMDDPRLHGHDRTKGGAEARYHKCFVDYLTSCDPDDLFVIVDCHV